LIPFHKFHLRRRIEKVELELTEMVDNELKHLKKGSVIRRTIIEREVNNDEEILETLKSVTDFNGIKRRVFVSRVIKRKLAPELEEI
jgi:hypothetical protein